MAYLESNEPVSNNPLFSVVGLGVVATGLGIGGFFLGRKGLRAIKGLRGKFVAPEGATAAANAASAARPNTGSTSATMSQALPSPASAKSLHEGRGWTSAGPDYEVYTPPRQSRSRSRAEEMNAAHAEMRRRRERGWF